MQDVHNGDGKGTPIYANFKYEECSDGKLKPATWSHH